MHDSNDKITCDCGNKFTVFDTCYQQRFMSCLQCKKVWRIGLSGRRLYSVNEEALLAQLEELQRPKL